MEREACMRTEANGKRFNISCPQCARRDVPLCQRNGRRTKFVFTTPRPQKDVPWTTLAVQPVCEHKHLSASIPLVRGSFFRGFSSSQEDAIIETDQRQIYNAAPTVTRTAKCIVYVESTRLSCTWTCTFRIILSRV
jgi:hypothetical protein